MKNRTRIFALLLAALMLLPLIACAKSDAEPSDSPVVSNPAEPSDSAEPTDDQPSGPIPGSVFRYWTTVDIPIYVPWLDRRNGQMGYNIYDNLLYKYMNDPNDIRGALAESWEVSEDGLTWVFQIRQDAYYCNGKQVKAADFIPNWDAAREYQQKLFTTVESYEATGEFELTVKLTAPSPTFVYELPSNSKTGIVDPELLEQYGPEDNGCAVGAGPYYVADYRVGEGYTLKANPYFTDEERMPSIETIEIKILPDENTAVIALLNGELDCLTTYNIETYEILNGEDGIGLETTMGHCFPFWYNLKTVEIFRDPVVREALCHMVDWESVNQIVFNGNGKVMTSIWEEGFGGYPYDEGYDFDPELGQQMLEDAGYSKDDIDFTILADPDTKNLVVAVVAQLNDLGYMNVDMVQYDTSTCVGMLRDGTYECFPCHNGYSPLTPMSPYTLGLIPEGPQHVTWFEYVSDERYQEAQDAYWKAIKSVNFEDYVAGMAECTRMIQEDNLAMGSIGCDTFTFYNDEFTGINMEPATAQMQWYFIKPAA